MSETKKPKTFCVSDESINCYRLRVFTAGIDTTAFEANPVMFYMHRRGKVFGNWEGLKKEGDKMYAASVFDLEDTDEEIQTIAGKVEREVIKAASIGLELVEVVWNPELNCYDVLQSVLEEISIVDIGGNKNALRLYKNGEPLSELQLSAELDLYKPKSPINTMSLKAIAVSLGLPETATEEQIQAKVELLNKNSTAQTELEKLQKSIKDNQDAKAIQLVDAAVGDKRILATQKEDYLKLFGLDFELAEKTLANLNKPADLAQFAASGQAQAQVVAGTKVELAAKWDTMQRDPTSPLLQLKAGNFDEYAKLYEAKFGIKPTK